MLTLLVLLLLLQPGPPDPERPIELVAFGSCARQDREQPIWDAIGAHEPELFLFIGDNVYADLRRLPESAAEIQVAYDALAARPEWQRFHEHVPVLATWDDHDYGKNDAGVEWELKRASQSLFLDFFGVPADSPRRARAGVYSAHVFGPPGKRLQVLMLDTRFHRSPLVRRPEWKDGDPVGPYGFDEDTSRALLGEEQWAWLEEELRVPADLRILGSSIQLVASEHGWEGWAGFPHERRRLLELIDETDANGVVVVSGDRHLVELSCDRGPETPYPIWDFTSSGLNENESAVDEPNRHRVGPVMRRTNFGLIRVDWERGILTLEARGDEDQVLLSQLVWLATLRER